jgi:hypothetical protein
VRSKNMLVGLGVVAALTAVALVVSAGNPDNPPGPPETTSSYTLEHIYDRLDTGAAGAPIAFTEPDGGPSVGTGTLVGTRWCDNGDGTVTDLLGSGGVGQCLVWMKNADCSAELVNIDKTGKLIWDDAVVWSSAVKDGTCGLTDDSTGYVWRLPTRAELDGITNGVDKVLETSTRAFTNVRGDLYWSSTTWAVGLGLNAQAVNMATGSVSQPQKSVAYYVWPVRGGQ